MMTESVLTSVDKRGVATVTMNQPAKHNAFDDTTIAQLSETFGRINRDNSIRVMVLAAAGKSFSAGADLAWMKRMSSYSEAENQVDAQALANMLCSLNELNKPTIAKVQGSAFGGAVGLISCCDIAFATTHAKFSLSEVKIGLIPATISPYVIAAIGQRAARRYFLSAEVFNAAQAQSLGLVNEVVAATELDKSVATLINTLLDNSPNAVAAAKRLIFDVTGKPIDDNLLIDTSKRIALIRVSKEGQEGLSAFIEKRQPNWKP